MKNILFYFALAAVLSCTPFFTSAQESTTTGNFYNNLQEAGEYSLVVFPNPANNTTRVVLPFIARNYVSVTVADLNGKIWQSAAYEPGGNAFDVDLTTLPAGIYSMRIQEYGFPPLFAKLVKQQ
jgi:hypothetical protein